VEKLATSYNQNFLQAFYNLKVKQMTWKQNKRAVAIGFATALVHMLRLKTSYFI
jgi:hypothetical protein